MAMNIKYKMDTTVAGKEFLEMFSMSMSTMCIAWKQGH